MISSAPAPTVATQIGGPRTLRLRRRPRRSARFLMLVPPSSERRSAMNSSTASLATMCTTERRLTPVRLATGGTVRVPAALCGVYGIRPTHGRIDFSGAMAMAPSFDVAGWFASGPGVFRAVGAILLDGPRSRDTIRNLIILDDAFAEADGDVAALLRSALDVMADELPKPAVARAARGGLDPWRECFRIIQAREVWINYGGFIDRYQPKLGPGIRERMAVAARVSDRDVESARREQTRASERIRSLAQPGTILCLPTAPSISPLLATSEQDLESFHFHFGSLRLGANR